MNNTFSLERAKNGEPFTYDGKPATFGSISPDGGWFQFWCNGGHSVIISKWYKTPRLSMTPKKLEVRIWRNRVTGIHDATTEDIADHLLRTADPNWELLKTKSEEI